MVFVLVSASGQILIHCCYQLRYQAGRTTTLPPLWHDLLALSDPVVLLANFFLTGSMDTP